jgi:phosphatidylethanolamine/phosphatidyl-N-methylethanolamine N-methyltransferase
MRGHLLKEKIGRMHNKSYDQLKKIAYEHTTHRIGVAERLNQYSSRSLERAYEQIFGPSFVEKGAKCLEVGAGKFPHIVQHLPSTWDKYVIDVSHEGISGSGGYFGVVANGSNLPFRDNEFTRICAIHSLEHIFHLDTACDEFIRVLRPRGVLSVIIPCDPGMLWSIAQRFSQKMVGLNKNEYFYLMANEHVNPVYNVLAILDYLFDQKHLEFLPIRFLPFRHVNFNIVGHWQCKS